MIDMKDVTAVIVDTRAPELATKTLLYMAEMCDFAELVLATNAETTDERVRVHRIPYIRDADHYNRTVVLDLADVAKSSHMLLCQCDGYVVNPVAWRPEWLAYDYIGAPWWYYPYNHMPPHPPSTPNTNVGNGGFSLRSTRLCAQVARLSHGRHITAFRPEDIYICRTIREDLEYSGCRWAPESVAWKFSCEDTPYADQFGFHGHGTHRINPQIPWVVQECKRCNNAGQSPCYECGRGGIAAGDLQK